MQFHTKVMIKALHDFKFDSIMSAEQYANKRLTIIFSGGFVIGEKLSV